MEGGKPENPERNPRSRDENQQQTQPTYDTGSGNRTRDTLEGGERSHHYTFPTPQRFLVHVISTCRVWKIADFCSLIELSFWEACRTTSTTSVTLLANISEFYQGDVDLDPELKEYIRSGGLSRNAIRARKRLWTGRIIPYRIPSYMSMYTWFISCPRLLK